MLLKECMPGAALPGSHLDVVQIQYFCTLKKGWNLEEDLLGSPVFNATRKWALIWPYDKPRGLSISKYLEERLIVWQFVLWVILLEPALITLEVFCIYMCTYNIPQSRLSSSHPGIHVLNRLFSVVVDASFFPPLFTVRLRSFRRDSVCPVC